MGNSTSSPDGNEDDGGHGGGNEGGTGRRSSALASRGMSHRIVGGGSNNNAHRTGLPHLALPSSLPSPFRNGGSLGLSRAELDARCQPSGLYPTCEWEPKQIRRLIGNGQLAARLKGTDSRLSKTDRECPICFMYYSESNVSKCCNATLCTECYLQIKPQKDRCTCPFCNNPKMVVTVQRGMDEGDVARRDEEEQRVIEATIRSRVSRLENGPVPDESPGGGDVGETASEGSFGSSLENYNRARTFSVSSNNSGSDIGGAPGTPGAPARPTPSADSDATEILSLAMSPADRRALESEMRAQLSHETHRRMESEAEEARMRHAQEWYGSQGGNRSRMREARLAELTGLLERMGARGGGGGSSAAGANGEGASSLMAMGADARGGGSAGGRPGNSLSRLLRAVEAHTSDRGTGTDLEDLIRVTEAYPAEDLVHSEVRRLEAADLMSRLTAASFLDSVGGSETAAATARAVAHRQERNIAMSGLMGRAARREAEAAEEVDEHGGLGGRGVGLGMSPSSPFGIGSGRHRSHQRVVRRLAGNRGVSSTHMDTAELLMRGVSEEEQLAMAIAMSMQDAQESQHGEGSEGDGGQERQLSGVSEGNADDDGGEESAEEDDDSSSSSGSSSSSVSSEENIARETPTRTIEGNGNDNEVRRNDNDGGAASLDNDEEVVFTDLASV
eukprot:CAMPEP_0172546416 /NCGR_PEP_ID=MMETSP1067-20121228/16192_1 /TAXON_ID=265564 ORGANISM="Thalassiosira punctigera, Strain Tpunct2005C2" /NCGR_SAMPLE_ID=MMETSP1067 /ASSEMBLY_ACC=CAM_ASM_000444 /LENGTH=674 /DNA_ID=CAMNT_0013333345 /DNA_START=198 /DNA_END=2222 /DNA_ORIENTATION=+